MEEVDFAPLQEFIRAPMLDFYLLTPKVYRFVSFPSTIVQTETR